MVHDGRHAVVIGSGIGGLLAARVLLDHFGRVTIVDRDRFPDRPDHRAGVPQSQHVHALLPRGAQIVYELFPGLQDELRADGAVASSDLGRAKIVTPAGLLPLEGPLSGADPFLYHSRPLLEWHLRERLRADARVRVLPATEVIGLSTTRLGLPYARREVSGVRVRYRDTASNGAPGDGGASTAVLDADLVVDASGRGSHAPDWLDDLGYGPVAEETLNCQLSYGSRSYARPEGFPDEVSIVLVNGRPPDNPRCGLLEEIENGVWHVSLGGLAGAVVPTDEEGFLRFASELPDPTIYEAIRVARPLTPIRGWRTPNNRLRRFERLPDWPSGLIVTGDAVCALNPIYGQGMTVAAMDAEVLRDCLADHDDCRPGHDSGLGGGFERAFQRRLARNVATPWLMASSEDLRWAAVSIEGARPPRGLALVRRYLDLVLRAAVNNPALAKRYFEVIGFLAPVKSLFGPVAAVRVLADARRRMIARRIRRRGVPPCPLALSPDGLSLAREIPPYQPPTDQDSGFLPRQASGGRP